MLRTVDRMVYRPFNGDERKVTLPVIHPSMDRFHEHVLKVLLSTVRTLDWDDSFMVKLQVPLDESCTLDDRDRMSQQEGYDYEMAE